MTAFDDGASSHDDITREILTWERFGDSARDLAQMIVDDNWRPDLVVAVARGGLLPAGAVSYALGVKAMGTMNVEFYTDVNETLDEPLLLDPIMDTSDLPGKKILVVDDVADSGKTLAKVMDMLSEFEGVEVKSAVIYHKPRSIITPNYAWKRTDDWIVFPWSDKPPVTSS
ncbi:phosphoribosyltransferase [Bowdeniella nasicola]|uniref:Phosphoribosyltransferase n=1 Tax=Bowdeniella nasicola TaxID=208480 RepID=A0A1Q5Q0Y8_9ACTO|nr:phosphoribosyltransferase [Bowdeniella nasicola]OKL53508.1 phosphoribosyltransferase [Bowdeniella nasicola]